MSRRAFGQVMGAGIVLSAVSGRAFAAGAPSPATAETSRGVAAASPPRVAMLVHPNIILLDHVGPQTVFSIFGAEIHLVWKELSPVRTDVSIPIVPTTTLADCPPDLDVLFVPSGLGGTVALMDDNDVLGFLASRGADAKYVTSVCTGSLLLGASGLLRGYRATSHWYVRDLLPLMGATVQADRVVAARNRITTGGVTAGLDLALQVVAALGDEETARRIQSLIECDPKPPFDAGSPDAAGQALSDEVRQRRGPALEAAQQAALRARDRLGTG